MMTKLAVSLCFLAMLLAPGYTTNQQLNRMLTVSVLLLLIRHPYKLIKNAHHWLFFGWLAWCIVGIYFSHHRMMAFQGFYPYRCEGFLTYILVTCLAVSYWKVFTDLKPLCYTCIAGSIVVITIFLFLRPDIDLVYRFRFENYVLPSVALGSFACLAGIVLLYINPLLSLFAVPVILISQNRTAMYSFAIVWVIYCLYQSGGIPLQHLGKLKKPVILVVLGVLILIPFLPYHLTKIPSFERMGTGARSHWLLESSNLAHKLPLTGFGLDTLSNYLTSPKGEGYELLERYICDKTHNVAYDIILETGWMGYTMLLLAFGYAVAICIYYPNKLNIVCLSVVLCWILFGFANPHGLLCNSIALTAFFGIQKEEDTSELKDFV